MPKEAKATEKLKNYLNGAWYWKHKKDYYAEKVLRLRSKAEKVTTTYSDAPTFGGFEDHRQAVMDEMMEKEKKYKKALEMCNKKLDEIRMLINGLEGYKYWYQDRIVLEMRYLHFENWQDIALKLNYEERQIYRIHGRALLHLLDVHKKIVETSGKALF